MDQTIKPLVIPVFIPHSGCPHQCAFCNQTIITNQGFIPNQRSILPDKKVIHDIVTQYSRYKGRRKQVELAFFGGNFLGLDHDNIIELLDLVQPYIHANKIDGIRFSTRPDTITPTTLDLIKPYTVSAVELGVQSMNDEVLLNSKRGHTRMDTLNAIHLLKEHVLTIGVQVMVGLPGDTEALLLDSTKELAELAPDFARIYPLVVLKHSLMAQWYDQGRYQPLSLEESVRSVKKMFHIFKNAGVNVIRMGLQASDIMEDKSMVLAGPWHPAFGHLVFSQILYDTVCCKIDQYPDMLNSRKLALTIHPKSESRLRGDKNFNLKKIKQRYPGFDFVLCLNEAIAENQVEINEINSTTKGKRL
ncbi:elongator complex protein 3 [Desulfobacula phenolica]|uniref:Radical_SAM C-terminal domain-containing protein n=1 Tax=Desulfobacula phenolica TaxID=90732 RepID=A0A1H2FMB5_9BACT|nr:radical SAM protein [Desulfobacula phenolica]SDU08487.1 Radical_SAM C-terminal domain-containing protein [Desulfobacula phenolica]